MTVRYGLRGSYRLTDRVRRTGRYRLTETDEMTGRHRLPRTRDCLPDKYTPTNQGQSTSIHVPTDGDRVPVKYGLCDKGRKTGRCRRNDRERLTSG